MKLIKRLPSWTFPAVAICLILGYLAFVASVLAEGRTSARQGGAPVFTDFTAKYAVSILVQQEPASNLYIPDRMFQATMAAAQAAYEGTLNDRQARGAGFAPWMYPPFFILVLYPLALLPYLTALGAWLMVTGIPYALAVTRAIRGSRGMLFAFAAPPAFYNLMFGQTGFLSGGLIGLGLSQVRARPVLAGICIGLASCKPHLGVLVPLALVAGEHWKPFGVATITVVTMIALSLASFGMDPWYGLIGTLEFYRQGFGAGAYSYQDMVTVQGMLQLAGVDAQTAWRAQLLAALISVGAVTWAWRCKHGHSDHLGLQIAVLCSATLLAVPMAYSYDMVLLIPGAAWLWADMQKRGATREQAALVLTLAALLPMKAIAGATGLQYGPVISAILLGIASFRLHELRRESPLAPSSPQE